MKSYTLEAIIDGEMMKMDHAFDSRVSALNYIFDYYYRHGLQDLVINDEYVIDEDKHSVEYVSDYSNRFRIYRCQA